MNAQEPEWKTRRKQYRRSGKRETVLLIIKPWALFGGRFCSAAWAAGSRPGPGRSSPGSAWRWPAWCPRSAARPWVRSRQTSAALRRAAAGARRRGPTPGPGAGLTPWGTRTTASGGHGSSSTGPATAQVRRPLRGDLAGSKPSGEDPAGQGAPSKDKRRRMRLLDRLWKANQVCSSEAANWVRRVSWLCILHALWNMELWNLNKYHTSQAWLYELMPTYHWLVCWKLQSSRVSFESQCKSFHDGFNALSRNGFALVEEGGGWGWHLRDRRQRQVFCSLRLRLSNDFNRSQAGESYAWVVTFPGLERLGRIKLSRSPGKGGLLLDSSGLFALVWVWVGISNLFSVPLFSFGLSYFFEISVHF